MANSSGIPSHLILKRLIVHHGEIHASQAGAQDQYAAVSREQASKSKLLYAEGSSQSKPYLSASITLVSFVYKFSNFGLVKKSTFCFT